jgi:hypothetical protein
MGFRIKIHEYYLLSGYFLQTDSDDRLTLLAFQEHCLSWLQGAAHALKANDVLRSMWERNLLQGFITRVHAENLIRCVECFTLCVRFSDSEDGVLAVGYMPDRSAPRCAVSWTKISPETLQQDSIVDILLRSRIPRIVDTQGNSIPCDIALKESEAYSYSSVMCD